MSLKESFTLNDCESEQQIGSSSFVLYINMKEDRHHREDASAFLQCRFKMVRVFTEKSSNFYRPQRSCGQGYVFTRFCHSVNRGRGSASVHFGKEARPPGKEAPPGRKHLREGSTPREGSTSPAWSLSGLIAGRRKSSEEILLLGEPCKSTSGVSGLCSPVFKEVQPRPSRVSLI